MQFEHKRLLELSIAVPRHDYDEPVRYPVACYPQARAAGSAVIVVPGGNEEETEGVIPDG